jgi:hypothetical protein
MKPSTTSRPRPPAAGRPAARTGPAASRRGSRLAGRFAARKRARRWAGVRPLVVASASCSLSPAWRGSRSRHRCSAYARSASRARARSRPLGWPPLRGSSGHAARARRHDRRGGRGGCTARGRCGRDLPAAAWHVVVRIVERSPVAVVRSGSALRLVDGDGVAYLGVARAPAGPAAGGGARDTRGGGAARGGHRGAVAAARPARPRGGRVRGRTTVRGPAAARRSSRRVGEPGRLRPQGGGAPLSSARGAAAVYDVSAPEVPTTRAR